MTKIKGTREGIVANDHQEDLASSVPLQMVVCKENCSSDGQNQMDGGARIVANDHLGDPSSSVLLRAPLFLRKWSFAKRMILRMTNIFFGLMEIRTRPALIGRILNTKFQLKQTTGSGVRAK